MTATDHHAGDSPDAPAGDEPAAKPAAEDGDELSEEEYRRAMSGLHRMPAPHTFARDVESTIRRRSAGRFFGRKAFGDRVPFEVLAILVLVLGLIIYFVLRGSQTGSLRYEEQPKKPTIAPGAKDVLPKGPQLDR